MPIYEYACTNCGEHTEMLQKVSEAPATRCPSCHTDALEKQISASAFHLKGNGWYVTDFKNDKKSEASKSDSKPSASPAAETKSTSNPQNSTDP